MAFVPFVREQMRIPTFTHPPVVPARGLHWHDTEDSSKKGRKRKEKAVEAFESRPKTRRRSSMAKVSFADQDEVEEIDDIVMEQVDEERQVQSGPGDSDDDEWADFKF
jgi:hypothetical protein